MPLIKDFSIIKIISRGAFGQVFLGYKNTDESKLFAIKVSHVKIFCSFQDVMCLQIFFMINKFSIGHEKIGDDKQKYGFTSDN